MLTWHAAAGVARNRQGPGNFMAVRDVQSSCYSQGQVQRGRESTLMLQVSRWVRRAIFLPRSVLEQLGQLRDGGEGV